MKEKYYNGAEYETASREHLNKFIDDLRKELVLNRMHLSEANRRVKELVERLNESERNAEALRQSMQNQEQAGMQLKQEFQKRLLFKDSELSALRSSMRKSGDAGHIKNDGRAVLLEENARLLSSNAALESAQRSLSEEFRKQLARSESDNKKMAEFIEHKESLISQLKSQYESQIAAKTEQVQSLNSQLRRNLDAVLQAEKLKGSLQILQESHHMLQVQYDATSNELAEAKRLLGQKEALLNDNAQQFENFTAEISRRNDGRIKDLVGELSEKELKLKLELEVAKNKLSEQEAMVAAKQKEIDAALDNFALASQHILSFKGGETLQAFMKEHELKELEKKLQSSTAEIAGREDELKTVLNEITIKEKGLSDRESQINLLMRKLEDRTESFTSAESALQGREQILMMQQQAFQKELAVLEQSGFEFREVKKEEPLETHPAFIEQPIAVAKPLAVKDKEVTVEKPRIMKMHRNITAQPIIRQAPEVTEAIQAKPVALEMPLPPAANVAVESKILPPPPQDMDFFSPVKSASPEKQVLNHEETFGSDREGYSEVEEISSMVEIAKSHGDSEDTIRNSLLNSGYAKEKIDKALGKIKV